MRHITTCAAVAALAAGIFSWTPLGAQSQTAAPAAEPPPPEAFFGRRAFDRAVLSPSGRWLAWVAAVPGRRNALVVHDLDAPGSPARPLAGFVVAAICLRFAYPSVSAEGKAIWLIQSSPIRYRNLVRVKVVPSK